MAFLDTSIEQVEFEIKKRIPFKIAPPKIKYLGINLTKEVKGLDTENYQTLIKETEDDSKKWKDIPCSWIGILINTLKWPYYPKQLTDLMQSLSNYP